MCLNYWNKKWLKSSWLQRDLFCFVFVSHSMTIEGVTMEKHPGCLQFFSGPHMASSLLTWSCQILIWQWLCMWLWQFSVVTSINCLKSSGLSKICGKYFCYSLFSSPKPQKAGIKPYCSIWGPALGDKLLPSRLCLSQAALHEMPQAQAGFNVLPPHPAGSGQRSKGRPWPPSPEACGKTGNHETPQRFS